MHNQEIYILDNVLKFCISSLFHILPFLDDISLHKVNKVLNYWDNYSRFFIQGEWF